MTARKLTKTNPQIPIYASSRPSRPVATTLRWDDYGLWEAIENKAN